MPLVERALQVLERREVRPQLGLLKSTMLQLDSSFSERAYGAGSFTDFIEKLRKADLILVTGGEGRYMIQRKRNGAPEKTVRPEEALPALRDVLENHRLEMEEGVTADDLANWVREEAPNFDWKTYGFQEFIEFLNYAQDKTVVRIVPDESTREPAGVSGSGVPSAGVAGAGTRCRAGGTGRGRGEAAGGARPAYRRFAPHQEGDKESRGTGCGRERGSAAEAAAQVGGSAQTTYSRAGCITPRRCYTNPRKSSKPARSWSRTRPERGW